MLIHSLFPHLIHMLFGHNTSRLYDSSIKAASFAMTLLEVICQHYRTLMYLVEMPAFLKSQQQGDAQVSVIACEDEITIWLPFARQVS